MTTAKRFGKRWNINECIQLQREFELLKLSIDDIAEKHQRTPGAIMGRLAYEGLADYNFLYESYYNLNSTVPLANVVGNDDEDDNSSDSHDDDQDNSSDYQEDDDNSSDYQEEAQVNECDVDDLKRHVFRLEKKVNELTQLILNENKTKTRSSLFSMFA
jgi:hypothetical protein